MKVSAGTISFSEDLLTEDRRASILEPCAGATGEEKDDGLISDFARRSAYFLACESISSKTGVSSSIGGHGATVNVGKNGPMVTLGIPGTGLSYRTPISAVLIIGLVLIALAAGIAYFVAPDTVRDTFALVAAALVLEAGLPSWRGRLHSAFPVCCRCHFL